MNRRPTHLAARALCWCAVALVLVLVAGAASPLAAVLTASAALNLHLWRRIQRGRVPQYLLDEIDRLRAQLNEREQALRAAIRANTPSR